MILGIICKCKIRCEHFNSDLFVVTKVPSSFNEWISGGLDTGDYYAIFRISLDINLHLNLTNSHCTGTYAPKRTRYTRLNQIAISTSSRPDYSGGKQSRNIDIEVICVNLSPVLDGVNYHFRPILIGRPERRRAAWTVCGSKHWVSRK